MLIQQHILTLRAMLSRTLSDKPDHLLTAHGLLDKMHIEAMQVYMRLHELEQLEADIKAALNDR